MHRVGGEACTQRGPGQKKRRGEGNDNSKTQGRQLDKKQGPGGHQAGGWGRGEEKKQWRKMKKGEGEV